MVLPEWAKVEQGCLEHGQVAIGILDLALDTIESFDVRLHELGSGLGRH